MPELVLAIDQGTTGTTVLAFDRRGRIRGRAYAEIRQYFPRPGWVEHDPEEIYRSVTSLSRKALRAAKAKKKDVAVIGITNQRETFVVWERKTGRPVHRAIVWQCRRSAEICNQLRDREQQVTRHTGLLVDPYFSGTKLKWLLDHQPQLRRRAEHGELCFGTIESWIVFRLSKGTTHISDFTNAARTMMLNLESLQWDESMLEMLGVPPQMLPTPISSRGPLAVAMPGTVADYEIPIGATIGDQQSALYGQGCVDPGEAKSTYGTGAFLVMNTGGKPVWSSHRLLTTTALGAAGESVYALEGSVFIAGAAIQWLRDGLGLIKKASDSLAMARSCKHRDEVFMVPAFVGLGAPHWDSDARGAVFGITRGTSRADLVRAALDSIAYQVRDVLVAMEADTGHRLNVLKTDGGAAANDYLMQFQADILQRDVTRPSMLETTALGAALLAGLAVNLWKSPDDFVGLRKAGKVFHPKINSDQQSRLVAGWKDAVSRVLVRDSPRVRSSTARSLEAPPTPLGETEQI